jgi:hypothetical protein
MFEMLCAFMHVVFVGGPWKLPSASGSFREPQNIKTHEKYNISTIWILIGVLDALNLMGNPQLLWIPLSLGINLVMFVICCLCV